MNKEPIKENYEKEEWGGWKIVSDMLDHPDENGIYPTSKCYQKLYEFVMAQKKKALQAQKEDIADKLVKIEAEKWKDAKHCTCLAYAIVKVFGLKYEKVFKKLKK